MKKVVNRALLTLMMLTAPLAANAETLAIVDLAAVVQQSPQSAQIGKQLEKEFGDRMAEVQKLQDELRALAEKQQRDGALMSETQRTEMQRKGESLQADLQLKGKALQEDLRRRQAEEEGKFMQKVQTIIADVAKSGGYDVVLQRGAVLYAAPSADISSKVVEALSKGN